MQNKNNINKDKRDYQDQVAQKKVWKQPKLLVLKHFDTLGSDGVGNDGGMVDDQTHS